ncbi:MAG TPA: fatty acid desaturase [Bacteroidales bacterium]
MVTVNSLTDNADRSWLKVISNYKYPEISRSMWQLINTFIPYVILWVAMYYCLSISYWLVLLLTIPASGFLIRLFIIFHDCGHGSFLPSKRANDIIGILIGILAFTPYFRWHHAHMIHHRTAGNLDKRGSGDVWTLTVEEYRKLSKSRQRAYRIYRHPLVMFGIGAALMFFFSNRFTRKHFELKERVSVYLTNLALLLFATVISFLIGLKAFLLIQMPVMYFAATAGVYLFYVQHQFPDVQWVRDKEWDYKTIALEGSSFLKLPKILQFFSGNIGFHHIHHLSSKIPNYKLEKCHRENELFKDIKPLTFAESFRCLKLRLWYEEKQRLVSFKELRLALKNRLNMA